MGVVQLIKYRCLHNSQSHVLYHTEDQGNNKTLLDY